MPGFRMSLTRAAFASSLVAFVSVSGPAHAVEPKLIEAAKKEGQVVWQTTLIVTQVVRPMVQAFEKKYPGIKVTFVPAPWQETALRLLNEGRAGTIKGDVTDGAATAYPLRDANLVERYVSEEAAAFAPNTRVPTGFGPPISSRFRTGDQYRRCQPQGCAAELRGFARSEVARTDGMDHVSNHCRTAWFHRQYSHDDGP